MTFEKLLQQSLLWRGFYFITLLLVNVVLSRYLKADGSGWVYYLTNFFSLILLVASLSMESGYTYFASGNVIGHNKLAWFSLVWTIGIGLIVAGVIYYYFGSFKRIPIHEANNYMLYALTYVCGILLINFFTVLFYAHKNFWLPNLLMGMFNLLLVAFIFFVKGKNDAYEWIVGSYFVFILLQGLVLGAAFIWINKSIGAISLPNKEELKLLFRYSLVALLGNLLFFFMYKIDYWFVKRYCTGTGDLGNYIQASKLAQMVLIVPQILASVIFPQTAGGTQKTDVGDSIIILFRILMQVIAFIMLVTLLIGTQAFIFVFGETFNNTAMPFFLLLPGIFAMSVTVLLAAFFSGHGHVKLNVIGTAIGLLVVVVLDVLWVQLYGIKGAALASSIGYAAFLLYALWHFRKLHPFSIKVMFSFSVNDWRWVKDVLLHKNSKS
jgi:O-antigen/teichoic acid export membrane protein